MHNFEKQSLLEITPLTSRAKEVTIYVILYYCTFPQEECGNFI